MDKNEEDLIVDIKGKVSPGKENNADLSRTRNSQENSEGPSLPNPDEIESEDKDLEGTDGDAEHDTSENNSELDGLETDPESEPNKEADSESEDESEDESDSEDNKEKSDEEEEKSADEEKEPEDKDNGDVPQDSRAEGYNNNRRNLNPNRSEAAKSEETPKSTESGESGGAASKLAGSAKDAIGDKIEGLEKVKKVKNVADKTVKAAESVANATSVFIQLIVNPITWCVLAGFVILIYTVSLSSSVGQNDFNIMCDSSGAGSITIDTSADAFTRQSAIASWLTSTPFELNGGQPLTKEQAAGIIGNMSAESYGANPKAIQGDSGSTKWETTSNDTVLSWGLAGGKAIGIVQWDTGRRVGLVNFAKSEGTEWHDLTTQLKYLKNEMESGYENQQLKSGGFHTPGKPVSEYTKIWNVYFERSGASGTPAGDNPRIALAEAFAGAYTGGGGVASLGGLSNNCVGGSSSGGGIDTSSLVQLAISAVHPRRADALENCGNNLVNCGMNTATDIYKKAKIAAEAATSKDPISGLLASCDRFVATIYRATGKDPSFPWGSAETQANYMKNSPAWEQISCASKQPGDVIWRPGHIMIYVGVVSGTDSIASASLGERSGNLSGMSCQGEKFFADGDVGTGFRKVK